TPKLLLRGSRSITGENSPLVMLDGIPVSSETLSILNPNDIETVSILRGGQGAVLYGSEGANGVIVITRKSAIRISAPQRSTEQKDKVTRLKKEMLQKILQHSGKDAQYKFYLLQKENL